MNFQSHQPSISPKAANDAMGEGESKKPSTTGTSSDGAQKGIDDDEKEQKLKELKVMQEIVWLLPLKN